MVKVNSVGALLLVLLLSGCSDDPPSAPSSPDPVGDGESYHLMINGPSGTVVIGEDVDTNWNPSSGLVYLGADDNRQPLGTVTMTIETTGGAAAWFVSGLVCSKTDVRVGTGPELNAKRYVLDPDSTLPILKHVTAATDYNSPLPPVVSESVVSGFFIAHLVTVPSRPTDPVERAWMRCQFLARKN